MPKITKTTIDNAKAPEKGDAWLWDSELEGFGIRIQSSGRKTYVVRYRTKDAARTQRKTTISRCTDLTPDRARDQARKIFAMVAEGRDPAAERKPAAVAKGATVEDLFKGYVAWMRSKRKASADEVERALLTSKSGSAADDLGRHSAAREVTPDDAIRHVQRFFKRGKRGAADKHRSYIASAFAWAIASANDYTVEHRQDWGVTLNPAAVLARDQGAIKKRSRNLSQEELRKLWNATLERECFSDDIGACIRVLIACGQRVQETLRLDGVEVSTDERVWKMPIEKTKTKQRPHTFPLPVVILPTMKELVERHGDGPLFPGRQGRENDRMEHRTIGHALGRWLAREDVDIPHFQTRDIRRTWKSRTADAGIDRFTRDLIQQHAKSDTGSKNYDWADYLPQMREAMQKWSAWLGIVLAGGTPPAYGEPLIKVA